MRRIDYVDLDELQPAPTNPKAHDQATMAASFTRFGYVEPIVEDERTGRLISGHGRREQLLEARAAGEPPPEGVDVDATTGAWLVPIMRGWASANDDEAQAAVIALNRIGERGGWDNQSLADQLAAFDDLAGLGFDQTDLDDLLASIQEVPLEFNDSAPDRYVGGAAGAEPTLAERGENYRNRQVRSMVFDYPLPDYARVAGIATRARRAFGIESNAELFDRLLSEWAALHPAPAEGEPEVELGATWGSVA